MLQWNLCKFVKLLYTVQSTELEILTHINANVTFWCWLNYGQFSRVFAEKFCRNMLTNYWNLRTLGLLRPYAVFKDVPGPGKIRTIFSRTFKALWSPCDNSWTKSAMKWNVFTCQTTWTHGTPCSHKVERSSSVTGTHNWSSGNGRRITRLKSTLKVKCCISSVVHSAILHA